MIYTHVLNDLENVKKYANLAAGRYIESNNVTIQWKVDYISLKNDYKLSDNIIDF